jgi:hypothetical protein
MNYRLRKVILQFINGAGFGVRRVTGAGSGFLAFRGCGGGFGYFPFAPLVYVVAVLARCEYESHYRNKGDNAE